MATAKTKVVKKRRTRKRRRKSFYKRGVHKSPKCKTDIKYRSGWEKTVCLHLDEDPLVERYEYESIEIPYISNLRTKKIRKYLPDFMVYYTDGRKIIIEVKRKDKLNNVIVMKKTAAGKAYAMQHGWEYVHWTLDIIKPLQKIQKARERYRLSLD